jgi:hypothetical protein
MIEVQKRINLDYNRAEELYDCLSHRVLPGADLEPARTHASSRSAKSRHRRRSVTALYSVCVTLSPEGHPED